MGNKAVIVPAAGSGTRLGSEVPKPFIELSGISILQRTLMPFLKVDGMMQIIISTSKDYMERCIEISKNLKADRFDFRIIEGGKERQDSIKNALKYVGDDIELVAVHDAVRPFVTSGQISECFRVAEKFDGAVLGVPAKDTVKRIDNDVFIQETPDRNFLWQAQTPQVFKKAVLLKAYNSAQSEGFVGTDDASLVERINGRIKMVEGSRKNLKITYPIDLRIAELIIGEKNE